MLGVLEELAGDTGDGDVVDVDVLFTNEVEQKIEGAVVHLADRHRERRLGSLFFFPFFFFGRAFGFGSCGSRWRLQSERGSSVHGFWGFGEILFWGRIQRL